MFDGAYLDWNQKRIKAFVEYYGHPFFFGKRVLDLGCGYGDIGGVLHRLGADITAVDARQEHLKIVDKKYNGVKIIRADLDRPWPFFGKNFDLTLDLALINHLQNFEEHLKAVCSSTNYLILETAVVDSADPDFCVVSSDAKNIYDRSFNGFNSQISAANIERVLTNNGMDFHRMDNAKFNSGPYKYDWRPDNNGRYDVNKRRVWFCVKNDNHPQIHNAANMLPPIINSGDFSPHILDSRIPITHQHLMITRSPQPPNYQQNKYARSQPVPSTRPSIIRPLLPAGPPPPSPPLTLSTTPGSRDFLVYIACPKNVCSAELFGDNRLFDVAYNDYTGSNTVPEQAEYKYSIDKFKFKFVKENIEEIALKYKACVILSDDIAVSTEDLNRLFIVGTCCNFNIWHPAYSLKTSGEGQRWNHIKERKGGLFRETNTVELSATFFSQFALKSCINTFGYNVNGIGLETVWMNLLQPTPKNFIIDAIPVVHTRPNNISTSNNNFRYGLSICAYCKDETPYLEEWLNFHRCVGVEHFYIYDNLSKIPVTETLKKYINAGFVDVIDFPGPGRQLQAHRHYIDNFKTQSEWCAFIDIDEFIVPKSTNNIQDILKDYQPYGALCVPWVKFSSNGHLQKPIGLVMENYTVSKIDTVVKVIGHMPHVIKAGGNIINAHIFTYQHGFYAVDEQHKRVILDHARAHNKIQINHYLFRSKEEFEEKLKKYQICKADEETAMAPANRSMNEFHDANTSYKSTDKSIFRFIEKTKKLYL